MQASPPGEDEKGLTCTVRMMVMWCWDAGMLMLLQSAALMRSVMLTQAKPGPGRQSRLERVRRFSVTVHLH